MRNRSSTFPEYSTVRVVKLRHADRWTEGGAPSLGDEGTVVRADERDDGVWYTVEHGAGNPSGRIKGTLTKLNRKPWTSSLTA